MDVRILRLDNIGAADESAWRDLAVRAMEPNPFMEPDCLIPAARHRPDDGILGLAVAQEAGRFVAALPFRSSWDLRRFPLPVVTTQIRPTIESGTLLLAAEGGADGLAVILGALRSQAGWARGRVLVLPKLNAQGPVAAAVREAAATAGMHPVVYERWEQPFLRRRDDGAYDGHLSKDFRSSVRRRRRRLAEELGSEPRIVERSHDLVAIETYLAMEATTYKSDIGVALTAKQGGASFFREVCSRLMATQRLELLSLEVDATTVAMSVLLKGEPGLFGFKTSFDEKFSRFGPGIQLHLSLMEHFHARTDALWIDTCCYRDNATLLRLYPDRKTIEGLCLPLSTNPLDVAGIRALMAARPLHRRLYDWAHRRQVRRGAATVGTDT